jgi:hypothetical protein
VQGFLDDEPLLEYRADRSLEWAATSSPGWTTSPSISCSARLRSASSASGAAIGPSRAQPKAR